MQQLLSELLWNVGNHMLEIYLHKDSKFRSNAARKGMSCHQLLFSDVVISEVRGLVTLSALSPLTSSRPSVRDKCLGCRTQRNSPATGYSLLRAETRVRTLKNETPVDKYFVDCLWFRQNLHAFSF